MRSYFGEIGRVRQDQVDDEISSVDWALKKLSALYFNLDLLFIDGRVFFVFFKEDIPIISWI